MVKKKISGQTLAIIILTALLIIAVTFGGVYAFYSARSNQVTGEIRMATLSIGFGWEAETGESICSAIVLSNGKQVVPGQELNNTPLVVTNESQASIYLIIVYEVNAEVKNNLGQTTYKFLGVYAFEKIENNNKRIEYKRISKTYKLN